MISVDADLGKDIVKIKGHAGFGKIGEDIVCAAVSMAADMMAAGAERTSPHEISDNGEMMLIQGTGDEWVHVMLAGLGSLSRLARKYPANVEVKIHG